MFEKFTKKEKWNRIYIPIIIFVLMIIGVYIFLSVRTRRFEREAYSGIVVSAKNKGYGGHVYTLDNGSVIYGQGFKPPLNETSLSVGDSVYKHPNSFVLDIYKGKKGSYVLKETVGK